MQAFIVKDNDTYFQFDSDEGQSQNTTKMSQMKSFKEQTSTRLTKSGLPGVAQKKIVDEEACKQFNADLLRQIISRKMQKNKTFFEIKVQMQH